MIFLVFPTAGSQAASEPEGGLFSGCLTCAWLVAHVGGFTVGGFSGLVENSVVAQGFRTFSLGS